MFVNRVFQSLNPNEWRAPLKSSESKDPISVVSDQSLKGKEDGNSSAAVLKDKSLRAGWKNDEKFMQKANEVFGFGIMKHVGKDLKDHVLDFSPFCIEGYNCWREGSDHAFSSLPIEFREDEHFMKKAIDKLGVAVTFPFAGAELKNHASFVQYARERVMKDIQQAESCFQMDGVRLHRFADYPNEFKEDEQVMKALIDKFGVADAAMYAGKNLRQIQSYREYLRKKVIAEIRNLPLPNPTSDHIAVREKLRYLLSEYEYTKSTIRSVGLLFNEDEGVMKVVIDRLGSWAFSEVRGKLTENKEFIQYAQNKAIEEIQQSSRKETVYQALWTFHQEEQVMKAAIRQFGSGFLDFMTYPLRSDINLIQYAREKAIEEVQQMSSSDDLKQIPYFFSQDKQVLKAVVNKFGSEAFEYIKNNCHSGLKTDSDFIAYILDKAGTKYMENMSSNSML